MSRPLLSIADMIRNCLFLISTLSHGIDSDEEKIQKVIRDLRECAEFLENIEGSGPLGKAQAANSTVWDTLLETTIANASLIASQRLNVETSRHTTLVIPLCGLTMIRQARGVEEFVHSDCVDSFTRKWGRSTILSEAIMSEMPELGPVMVVGVSDAAVKSHPSGAWMRVALLITEALRHFKDSGRLDLYPMGGTVE